MYKSPESFLGHTALTRFRARFLVLRASVHQQPLARRAAEFCTSRSFINNRETIRKSCIQKLFVRLSSLVFTIVPIVSRYFTIRVFAAISTIHCAPPLAFSNSGRARTGEGMQVVVAKGLLLKPIGSLDVPPLVASRLFRLRPCPNTRRSATCSSSSTIAPCLNGQSKGRLPLFRFPHAVPILSCAFEEEPCPHTSSACQPVFHSQRSY